MGKIKTLLIFAVFWGAPHLTSASCKDELEPRGNSAPSLAEFDFSSIKLKPYETPIEMPSEDRPNGQKKVLVHFPPESHFWRQRKIWTDEEYKRVARIMGPYRYGLPHEGLERLNDRLGSLGSKLATRIRNTIRRINRPRHPSERFKCGEIYIHYDVHKFRFFHRHGGGENLLVMSESGEITETETHGRFYNDGGMVGVFSDGEFHRPPLDNYKNRITIFAQLIPVTQT